MLKTVDNHSERISSTKVRCRVCN